MASDFPVSQCSGIYGATFERVAVTTSLSSPQSANSSTTCSQAGSSSIHTLERGELMCPKEKFDLLDWMKFVFLDDADEEEIQRYVCLFSREGITSPRVLSLLTDEDMKTELRIKLGHRRLLLNAIANLPVSSSCRDPTGVPCMIEMDSGCELLDFSGGICSLSGTFTPECELKSKKSDRAISKNSSDFQLRIDLKADRPVQRNNMQQMKLESFMSRVTQSYPKCEVVNEMTIKCSICQKIIKLNNLRCMENFDRHYIVCSQKRFAPYVTNFNLTCQQFLPMYTQSLICPTSQSVSTSSSLSAVPLQCPITMIPICNEIKPETT